MESVVLPPGSPPGLKGFKEYFKGKKINGKTIGFQLFYNVSFYLPNPFYTNYAKNKTIHIFDKNFSKAKRRNERREEVTDASKKPNDLPREGEQREKVVDASDNRDLEEGEIGGEDINEADNAEGNRGDIKSTEDKDAKKAEMEATALDSTQMPAGTFNHGCAR